MRLLPAFTGVPERNQVYHVDALTLLAALPDKSVDMVLVDPPYGVLQGSIQWEIPFDLTVWWTEIKRVLKPQSACVITAVQPFTSKIVSSNLAWFRQELIWGKTNQTDFLNANNRHLRIHENILIFSDGGSGGAPRMRYYPQMAKGEKYIKRNFGSYEGYNLRKRSDTFNEGTRYPTTILKFGYDNKHSPYTPSLHPTQKPVKLFEYLIQTYTLAGDTVLDCFAGSGTTAVAARNLNRNFICGDITLEYVEMARKRLVQPYTLNMFIQLEQRESVGAD